MKYEELSGKPEIAALQEEILDFWKKEKIFEKSVDGKKDFQGKEGEEVVFYDGPPFPTGKPHHGTCRLYKSPSPRDKRQCRMQSSA